MMKTLITLIALTAMQLVHAQVPSGVPWATANGQITQPGIMAVTCGVLAAVPAAERYTFGLKDVRAANLAPMPTNNMDYSKIWYPPVYHHPDWTLEKIGNVFGICFDTDGDIYVSASSSYNDSYFAEAGLVRYGQIGGGANSLLAAGTVYKIDKTTGIPTVFCQLPQQATVLRYSSPLSEGSVRVTGPGLGDICYDAERNQFFVSNFEDGKIYRISATGAILDSYDPFVADNGAEGAAPENERVWALQVSAGRLYFSTWTEPVSQKSALHSVPISALGTPSGTVDLFHVSVGTSGPDGETPKMSDIAFNAQGDLLVAERTMGDLIASYNHESRVYHFKKTGSSWITSTISPGHNFHEGYGGADWGYDGATKEGFIWAASADLLDEPGPHGVQGWRIADTPVNGQLPYSKSVIVPFMPASQNPQDLDVKGFGGDLEIYDEPCISIADGAVTICEGTTTNLTTPITGYANLLSPVWTVATAGGTSVTTPTAVMPSVTTTYVLVAQNAAGCRDTANVVVTVNPKPNAGSDQTLACTNNVLPTSFDLVDAAVGQKWKIISPVPAGASISVTTPAGAVTGTIVAGVYKFRLQTQSDSVNCADTVQVTIQPCATLGTLGDYVWKDTNDNGIQDEPASAGVKDVVLELYKNGTATGIKDTTDATGKYLFSISDSASYQVKILSGLPSGCTISTKQNASGSTDANDSDFNPTSGLSDAVTVNPLNPTKKDVLTVDAALVAPCPTLPDEPDQTVCSGTKVTLTVANMTNITNENIKFVYFTTHQGGNTASIYGASSTNIGTVLNANLSSSKTTAALANVSFPVNNTSSPITYHVYAILDPTSANPECRPFSHRHIIVNPVVNAGKDSTLICTNGNVPTSVQLTGTPSGGTWEAKAGNPTGVSISNSGLIIVTNPTAQGKTFEFVYTKDNCKDTTKVIVPTCVVPKGSLGDYVWKDTNDNGIQDEPASAGVSGVILELYKNGTATGIKDTTDATGKYLFSISDSASYQVKIVSGLPAGCTISTKQNASGSTDANDSDFNPTSGLSDAVTVNPSNPARKDVLTVDAALYSPKGSLGDYVWKDTNDNGIQDEPASAGVKDVVLELYKNGTATGIKDTTDATGKYLFSISDSASYQVKIVSGLPSGCTISTKQNASGSTDANDSDFNPTSGLSDAVTVNPSNPARKDVLTVDAALYSPKGSLGDYVWKDTNDNGIQDEPASAGVSGVILELYKNGTATGVKDTTDATGKYLFSISDSASYQVKIVSGLPAGCTISTKQNASGSTDANDSDFNPTSGLSDAVTVNPSNPARKDVLTVDAALYSPKGSLGDYVWKDTNNNGIQDETGTGVSGVILELYKNGTATGIKDTTDATGKYLFSISDSASYQVKIVSGLPAGCTISTKQNASGSTDVNDSDFNPTTGLSDTVTVNPSNPARKDVLTVDAALYSPKGSLGDYVWKDTNDNGIQDETGTGVSGVILELYKNGTATGIKDTTDATGKYLFSISDSASYQVKIVSGLPAGCTISTKQNASGSTDANDSDFNPTSGLSDAVTVNPSNPAKKDVLTVDAALYSPRGSLGDFVWKDTNNNGIQDETTANNGGVAGVQIELYKVGTASAIAKDTTDAAGKYLFTNLDAGQYYIKVLASSIPVGCTISTMKDVSTGGGTEANDSDVDPATGQSGNNTIDLLDPAKKDILTVDAALIALCPKPTLTINSAPTCSQDKQTYSVTFSVTGTNGILKANGIALIGNNPYVITLPSGTNLTITDSLSSLCKHDTTILAPSCGCPISAPVAVAPSVVACQGEGMPMLSVSVPTGATANWYASQTSTNALVTNSLTYTPTTAGTYWVEAVVIGPQGCVSTVRTPIILSVISTSCVPVTLKILKK